MIIYKDIISTDELVSDSYGPLTEVDGVIYEIECKNVTVKDDNNINIGANPSAEEGDESLDSNAKSGLDIVLYNRLEYLGDEASKTKLFNTKKDYFEQLKKYMGKVKALLVQNGTSKEEIDKFTSGATRYYTKHIVPNFKNYEFYTGSTMDLDAMIVLLEWRDEETKPVIAFWKHGLEMQKC